MEQITAAGSTSEAFYGVTFSGAAQRRIRIYLRYASISGVYHTPTGSVKGVDNPTWKVSWLGDSWVDGSTGANFADEGIVTTAERILGCEMFALGQGGTGYCAPGAAQHTTFGDAARIAGLASTKPELIVISGTSNDDGFTGTQIQAAAAACYAAIATACPGVPIVVIGPPSLPTNATGRLDNRDAVRAAAAAAPNVIKFVDQLDVTGTLGTSAAPAWQNNTAYAVGDRVTSNRFVYECFQAHTSGGGVLSLSVFKVTSLITGTGKIGSTTGSGNSDLFINSDAVHPSSAGHGYCGRFYAEQIAGAVRALAA